MLREGGIAPPGTVAMCQTGGEEQRWRERGGGGAEKVVENKVELPGSLSAVNHQHPAPFIGQQVLDRQKHSCQYLRSDAITAECHGNACAAAFDSVIEGQPQ